MENENEFLDPQENPADKKEEGISSDLIRGHINTIILRTLATGDKYGYEIIDEIESKSRGQYSIKQPTLYSALKRLESQGYVTSYWGGSSGGGRRRYFKITDEGAAFSLRNQEEWMYSRSIIDSLISEAPAMAEAPAKESPLQAPPATSQDFRESIVMQAVPSPSEEEPDEKNEAFPENEEDLVGELEEPAIEEDKPVENNSLSVLREQSEELSEAEPESPYEEKKDPPAAGAYKDVIGKLYNNAIDTAEVAQKAEKKNLPKAEPQQISGNIEFFNILERAEYDGIKVKTSGMYKPKETIEENVPTAFFNRGKAMFYSSLATLAFLLVEFIIILATRQATELSIGYPLTVLALSIAMVAVFTALYLLGFGKNAILNKNMSFLIFSFIAFGVAILLIVAFAISSQAVLSEPKELVKYIVFPALIASNVIVFACFYRFFRKRT